MKKVLIGLLQTTVIIAIVVIGIFVIHFLFIMGVDAVQEKQLVAQCQAYAQSRDVRLIKAINVFTYEENTNHAVCLIEDIYERYVFIDEEFHLLVSRNAKSYQTLDVFDARDSKQSYTLALHQGNPVYVYKKVSSKALYIAYYHFDTAEMLFEVNSEE